jgi:hypothetical protein
LLLLLLLLLLMSPPSLPCPKTPEPIYSSPTATSLDHSWLCQKERKTIPGQNLNLNRKKRREEEKKSF